MIGKDVYVLITSEVIPAAQRFVPRCVVDDSSIKTIWRRHHDIAMEVLMKMANIALEQDP